MNSYLSNAWRRIRLFSALVGVLLLNIVGEARPNVLVIFPDDLGYEAIGAYGGLLYATPEIDAMASQGVRFSRAYTSPVCTPSRVSLHTGTYTVDHGHTGVLPVHAGTTDFVDFVSMPTFAQLLQADGYATSVTGKWQLATLFHHPDHPLSAGFDSWCVWQIWDGVNGVKTTRYDNPSINRDGYLMDGSTLVSETTLPTGQVLPAGTILPDATSQFGPDVTHAYVKERMADAVSVDEPFFIMHNMMLPHSPIVSTPAGGGASLANMISYMDGLVGDLLDEIETLGIRENTYVFFIGDNGTDVGADRLTLGGIVTGGKRDLSDGGTHVPFIVWGPPGITPGTVEDGLVDITDVFPTICGLAGVDIPESIPYRGNSIVPQIHGRRGVERSWVHGGIDNQQSVFDGSWRSVKTGISGRTLVDSRQLPAETDVVVPASAQEVAAERRLDAIFNTISSTTNAVTVTVDNSDSSGAVVVGDWVYKTNSGYEGNYQHDSNAGKGDKSVTYHLPVPASGNFSVEVFYPSAGNRADNVPVTITHANGSSTVILNQKINGNAWFSLGDFDFDYGTEAIVTFDTTNANGFVIADGVRLVDSTVSGYFMWQLTHFGLDTLLDPALEVTSWGDSADPDQDGVSNYLEYVFGLNPLEAGYSTVTPQYGVEGGRPYFRAVLRKSDGVTVISPQVSENLALDSWDSVETEFDIVSIPLNSAADEQTFILKESPSPPAQAFLRFEID